MTFLQKRKFKYYGWIFVLITTTTLSALWFLQFYDNTYRQYLQSITRLSAIEQNTINVQYSFKRQVQEWKNILLRGDNPEDYEKYNEAFTDEFVKTQQAAESLYLSISDDSQAKKLAEEFMTYHQALLADYQDALAIYEQNNFNAQLSDRAVRGIDREPTETLEKMSNILNNELIAEKRRIDNALDRFTLIYGGGFILVQVAICWILLRVTGKLLRANIEDRNTGLGNRELFVNSISDAVSMRETATFAIFDINNFKLVNEAFGNSGGDDYLRLVGAKMQKLLEPNEYLCRVGGDLIGVVMKTQSNDQTLKRIKALSKEIKHFEYKPSDSTKQNAQLMGLKLSASAGVFCMHLSSDDDTESLLNKLYVALHHAKEIGPGSITYYTEQNREVLNKQQQMRKVSEVIEALESKRIVLFRQEIRPLKSSKTKGYYEVLMRVMDTEGKLQPPGLFLQAAERFNLMREVDRYIVSHLIDYIHTHPEDKSNYTVNLSGATLSEKAFVTFIDKAFAKCNFSLDQIGFEITETDIIKNFATASKIIEKLKSYGCKISLDDFGTGMSSYSYISQLHIDTLKIDGTFIKDIDTRLENQAILRSITTLANELKINTVAEFIETKQELDMLNELGIDYGQGFLLNKPSEFFTPSANA